MPTEVRDQIIACLPRLRRFALALTGDSDSADDLVQEACVRALSNLDQFREGTRLDSWLFRIAQNAWIDRGRSSRSRTVHVAVDDIGEIADDRGEQVIEQRSTLHDVSQAISELPEELQMLVVLICIDGRSYSEAAAMTNTPIGTVMSRLARARRLLHQALNTDELGEPVAVGAERR